MAKVFDFNALKQETLETRLDENTTVHVTTPPERLIEQLAASQGEIDKLMNCGDTPVTQKSGTAYDLMAKLISCNTEGVTVTADDLRHKYKIHPTALAVYAAAYMDFINEFHNAKN